MANTYSLDLEAGSSQYAYASDSPSLSPTGDCTFEFWTLRESINIGATFIGKWADGSTENSYGIDINSNNDILLYISSTGTTYSGVTFTNSNLTSTTSWYHIAIVYTASAGSATLYINGVLNETKTGLPTSIYNGTRAFWLGRDHAYNQYYDGLLDEVRIWGDVRTQAEIVANMYKELVGDEAGLNAYWRLNNAYTDLTANANTLTPSGSPVFSTTVPFTALSPATGYRVRAYATNSAGTSYGDTVQVTTLGDTTGASLLALLIK